MRKLAKEKSIKKLCRSWKLSVKARVKERPSLSRVKSWRNNSCLAIKRFYISREIRLGFCFFFVPVERLPPGAVCTSVKMAAKKISLYLLILQCTIASSERFSSRIWQNIVNLCIFRGYITMFFLCCGKRKRRWIEHGLFRFICIYSFYISKLSFFLFLSQ